MAAHIAILLASFIVILAGSEMFTNGVEWAGERMSLSEAAVGSLLAAVGTALPETLIPAVALLMGGGAPGAHSEGGVGAIIGAPCASLASMPGATSAFFSQCSPRCFWPESQISAAARARYSPSSWF